MKKQDLFSGNLHKKNNQIKTERNYHWPALKELFVTFPFIICNVYPLTVGDSFLIETILASKIITCISLILIIMKASYLYIPKTRGSRLFSAVRIMCSVLFLSMVFDDELNKRIEEPLQKKYCIFTNNFMCFICNPRHSIYTHLLKP